MNNALEHTEMTPISYPNKNPDSAMRVLKQEFWVRCLHFICAEADLQSFDMLTQAFIHTSCIYYAILSYPELTE